MWYIFFEPANVVGRIFGTVTVTVVCGGKYNAQTYRNFDGGVYEKITQR